MLRRGRGRREGWENTLNVLVIAAMLFAFVLLLWAFAVLVWDFLKERTRGWLRMLLVVVLAPLCALATALITSAVISALEPHEGPARIESAEPETTSQSTGPEKITNGTGTPSPSPSVSPSATSSPSASASPSASPSP